MTKILTPKILSCYLGSIEIELADVDYEIRYRGPMIKICSYSLLPESPTLVTFHTNGRGLKGEAVAITEICRPIEQIKPILRPLTSMTNDEATDLIHLGSSVYSDIVMSEVTDEILNFDFEYSSSARRRKGTLFLNTLDARQFLYLLGQGFDLFGLIKADLAIDRTLEHAKV